MEDLGLILTEFANSIRLVEEFGSSYEISDMVLQGYPTMEQTAELSVWCHCMKRLFDNRKKESFISIPKDQLFIQINMEPEKISKEPYSVGMMDLSSTIFSLRMGIYQIDLDGLRNIAEREESLLRENKRLKDLVASLNSKFDIREVL